MPPKVSIVILSWKYPHIIDVCLKHLEQVTDIPHEVVVVSNGNTQDVVDFLITHKNAGRIDTLAVSPINLFFSGGNNFGFRHCHPESEYIVLLNSDVAILRPDWLSKYVAWMEGTPPLTPNAWCINPTTPSPGPRDIVSMGWAFDSQVEPGHKRPDGFCIMIRRTVWQDLDENFPMSGGLEHSISQMMLRGATCGVLSQYGSYFIHKEQACETNLRPAECCNIGIMDLPGWFQGLNVESLDFTLGPLEHGSYLLW